MPHAEWLVLLVGGASGVGKTTLGRALARRFDVPIAHADDIRLALESMSTPDVLPALHQARASLHEATDPELLRAQWTQCARTVSQSLEIIVLHHVVTNSPIVIEGDTVLPELAGAASISPFAKSGRVRFVVLGAPSEAHLARNTRQRGRGVSALSEDAIRRYVRRNWLYQQWLIREARRFGVPVVTANCDELGARVEVLLADWRQRALA